MGERVEERTGGNGEFTGKACAKGAAGRLSSLHWEVGGSPEKV